MQTEVQRDPNSKGGEQKEALRSPAFIYSCSSWWEGGVKLVGTAEGATLACPSRLPSFTQVSPRCGGVWVAPSPCLFSSLSFIESEPTVGPFLQALKLDL